MHYKLCSNWPTEAHVPPVETRPLSCKKQVLIMFACKSLQTLTNTCNRFDYSYLKFLMNKQQFCMPASFKCSIKDPLRPPRAPESLLRACRASLSNFEESWFDIGPYQGPFGDHICGYAESTFEVNHALVLTISSQMYKSMTLVHFI